MSIRDHTPFNSRKRLAETDDLRDSLADNLGDIVSTHEPDGTYRFVSAAAKDILGLEPDEIMGRRPFDYVHPEDRGKLQIVFGSVLGGNPSTVVYRVRREDNEYVWLETTLRAVRDGESGAVQEVVCSSRPVEDRARLERMSANDYQEAVERMQDVIENERIDLVFQPIFDLETGAVIAYEALSRFPGNGAKGPDRWFAEAWHVGLGIPLELLAVRRAAAALARLPEDVVLCVNASPPTIVSEGFLDSLGGEAGRVNVELTEHLHVEDYESFDSRLGPLRAAGAEIAIDDFGAGYASLRHILKLKPEWIKLDISLTERIDESQIAHALGTSLISFADEVGLRVIAEGIETEDQLETLREIGFRYGQGFYFGVPAPLDEALMALS